MSYYSIVMTMSYLWIHAHVLFKLITTPRKHKKTLRTIIVTILHSRYEAQGWLSESIICFCFFWLKEKTANSFIRFLWFFDYYFFFRVYFSFMISFLLSFSFLSHHSAFFLKNIFGWYHIGVWFSVNNTIN